MLTNIVLTTVFDKVIWPLWIGAATSGGSRGVWVGVFQRAADACPAVGRKLGKQMASAPGIKRLLMNTFRADRKVPSAEEFAIAIAFELEQQDFQFHTDRNLEPWVIRAFAATVRREWLSIINASPVLKARFVDVRNRHPAEFLSSEASCLPALDDVLSDATAVKKSYFSSFSTHDATERVVVWLPDDDGVVNRDKEGRITVDVLLNPTQGADLGFFRMGHDYSINDTSDRVEWLHVSYLDKKRAMEGAQFGGRAVGRITSDVLWAR